MAAWPRARPLVVTIVTWSLVAACSAARPTTITSPAPSPTASTSAIAFVDRLTITVDDIAFHADPVGIRRSAPGVAITFRNDGRLPHTLTFYSNPGTTLKIAGGDTGFVQPGVTVKLTLAPPDGANPVYYLCEIHPTQMYGWLAVG